MDGLSGVPEGAALAADIRAAYERGADEWARGPAQVYGAMARALVAAAGVPVAGQRVLDVGTGTGVAARAALAAGARQVVAVDFALGMLRHAAQQHPAATGGAGRLHPVAADAAALPFRGGSFGLIVTAFCLSHLRDLAAGLAELHRAGRALAASAFAPGWSHPAQGAVDEVLRSYGYRPPGWYLAFKARTEPAAGDPELLTRLAAEAGFANVRVRTLAVPTGLTTPAGLAAWRLGMAPVVPFLRSLPPHRLAALREAAQRAVAGAGPLVVSMQVLTAGQAGPQRASR
ncbi:MAG: class I SAM-dependent methyltransferase [Gemmatimonadota bacterium]